MIRLRGSKLIWSAVVMAAVALGAGLLFSPPKVSAGSCGPYGIGYFSGNDYSCTVYGPGGNNVDPGHFSTADTSKSKFINAVESSSASAFYIDIITGNGNSRSPSNATVNDFEDIVNNPAIGIKVSNVSNAKNSLYLPTKNDYAFYTTSSPHKVASLVLYNVNTGTDYSIIKIDCGNPLNTTATPNINAAPSGSLTVSCTQNSSGVDVFSFSYKFADADGGSSAKEAAFISSGAYDTSDTGHALDYTTAGSPYTHGTGSYSATTNTWPGVVGGQYHKVWLRVADIHPDGSHTWTDQDNVSKPSCDDYPSGNLTVSCTVNATGTNVYSFTYTFADADGSSSAKEAAFISSGAYDPSDTGHALDYTTAGSPYTHGTGTYSVATNTWPGVVAGTNHNVWLRVANIHPDGSHTWTDLDNVPRPPCSNPNNPPTGTINASCDPSADGSGDIAYSFSDPDGNTSAVVTVNPAVGANYTISKSSSGSYTANLTPAQAAGPWSVSMVVQDHGGSQNKTFTDTNPSCVPPTATCITTANPTVVSPGQTTNIAAIVSVLNYTMGTPTGHVVINGTTVPMSVTGSLATGSWTLRANYPYTVPLGTYNVPVAYTGTVASTPACPAVTVVAAAEPYLKIFGGDIEAGFGPSQSGSSCVTPSSAIESWNNDSAGNYSGAGTQFGAQALGIIEGFVSAQSNAGGEPSPGSGLSFANKTGVGGDLYGGNFSNNQTCVDYSAGLSSPASSYTTPGVTTVTNGTHTVVYVKGGDAYLGGNVVYTGSGSYSLANLPSYKLVVVGGDIYVNAAVSELDGLYVAEPDSAGNGGTIYTCATGPGAAVAPTTANFYTTCGTQLKIYGSFVAKKIDFLRTFGDAAHAAGDTTNNPVGAATQAGEEFIYSPEEWLGQPSTGTSGTPDAITSLPPVL